MTSPMLIRIRQVARAGDTMRAWRMFGEAGLHGSLVPEALSLKGRLLKDRAQRSKGAARARLLREAHDAYRQAAGDRRATYPLINAATIACLNGDNAQAEALARHVLDLLASGDHEPETRYWLGATAAEALLLLGDTQGCRKALAEAVALAPDAWEDQAATLSQLRAILAVKGLDSALLDGFGPPPSLYFSGIILLADREDAVRAELAAVLEEVTPASVHGALAAGVDILIAERALARGAELHVVLPGSIGTFRETSVTPFGAHWLPRFDALLEQAHSVTCLDPQAPVSRAGIDEAARVAMGLAIRSADALAGEALALRAARKGDALSRSHEAWRARGLPHREVLLDHPAPVPRGGLGVNVVRTVLASLAPFPPGVAGQALALAEAGHHLALFEDPAKAMALAAQVLALDPDARLGLDTRSTLPDADLHIVGKQAGVLARGAMPGEVCAPWPQAAAFDLVAPQYRFETGGEIVTALGDIPVGRYLRSESA
ncbi:DUF4071 domain-containing protein [Novosphingobium sp. YJ-S2-02]|uniref:DUF4071 domain-containing protein n=1 Tax=Novosphingobium aureum TaxID=2792964 RepID=A0A931HDZ6_9SPHN|nr:TRAFs-binding domain-containing protein [Novosphingobium aureum]MBH0114350.1 DUF4071 domain-containing protein [Novosphingobium aureum]